MKRKNTTLINLAGPKPTFEKGKARIECPAIYHVMNRGDRRESTFVDDADRRRFVETLAEACTKTGWQVHAWGWLLAAA